MLIVEHLDKRFDNPTTQVLFDLNFKIEQGEFVSITGRSGSGKSTLLYILSTLDMPSAGVVRLDERSTSNMTEKELHAFRNTEMGFVFQFHFLLPELTAIENVLMPARKLQQHLTRTPLAEELLTKFGLESKMHRLPTELSGGEQQRVAIARALIMQPRFIFADEPTGNLDSISGQKVMDILEEIATAQKTSVIFVTHDREFAARAKRQIQLSDGRIIADLKQ